MTRRRALLAAVLLLVAAVVVAVILVFVNRSDDDHSAAPSTSPSTGASDTDTGHPVTSGIKPIIRGLIDRQSEPRPAMLPYVHAYVVKVAWKALQPSANGPIAANNAIDKAVSRVRQADFRKVGMTLKLRVLAGIDAPDWVKSLGGAPVAYKDNQAGASVAGGTIARFWTPAVENAYAQLQAKLAAKYDAVPEIREVTVAGCSTIFDEPFVRQPGDTANVENLKRAGYTVAADKACITAAIKAHEVWRHTTTDLDFSPFANTSDPGGARDLGFTLQMMSTCRQLLQYRCGLQNNALSTQKLANKQFSEMYARMQQLGSPLVFQTAARKRLGNEAQVLQAAVKYGANSVELPQGYPKWDKALLQTAARGLAANPAR